LKGAVRVRRGGGKGDFQAAEEGDEEGVGRQLDDQPGLLEARRATLLYRLATGICINI
jgi:hypothetical protein